MNSHPNISLDNTGRPFCLSTDIAAHFEKRHDHVLRDIDNLLTELPASFTAPNFGVSDYTDSTGRKLRQYRLSRDGFALLVMGFTGRAALMWKLKYIEAFNNLEKLALERQAELAREAGFLEGRQEALTGGELEIAKKKAYLEGMKEGERQALKKDRLAALEKMVSFVRMGLNHAEIGRILGLKRQTVSWRIRTARQKGFWPPDNRESQLALPGVE